MLAGEHLRRWVEGLGEDLGQAVLLGRFNRLYGVVGAAPLGSGYRGRVGFITD